MVAAEVLPVRKTLSDKDGRRIVADVLSIENNTVEAYRVDAGQTLKIPFALLQKRPSLGRGAELSLKRPMTRIALYKNSDRVSVPEDLNVGVQKPQGRHFVYRTQRFEYHSPGRLTRNLVREFGAIFEATYEAVMACPCQCSRKPELPMRVLILEIEKVITQEEASLILGGPTVTGCTLV